MDVNLDHIIESFLVDRYFPLYLFYLTEHTQVTKSVIRFCFALDIHSEKVERRRSINEEREKSRIFDKIISQVTRDFEEEEKSTRYNDRPRKITKLAELSSITDPAYLCELLDNDKDPERIEVN